MKEALLTVAIRQAGGRVLDKMALNGSVTIRFHVYIARSVQAVWWAARGRVEPKNGS